MGLSVFPSKWPNSMIDPNQLVTSPCQPIPKSSWWLRFNPSDKYVQGQIGWWKTHHNPLVSGEKFKKKMFEVSPHRKLVLVDVYWNCVRHVKTTTKLWTIFLNHQIVQSPLLFRRFFPYECQPHLKVGIRRNFAQACCYPSMVFEQRILDTLNDKNKKLSRG